MIYRILAMAGMAALLTGQSFAQASGDVAYCNALSNTYRGYIGNARPDADASQAMGKCSTQPATAIPVLEKILTQNKVKLPPRT